MSPWWLLPLALGTVAAVTTHVAAGLVERECRAVRATAAVLAAGGPRRGHRG